MKYMYAAALLLWIILSMGACGESISLRFCDPGETKTCTCYSGEAGQMICQSNALAWSACNCEADGDISDGDAPESNDGDMDAENDTGDEELREIIACDDDTPCPIPYRCDYATGFCEIRKGFCLDSRDCETNQGYCEAYPGYDYGRCRDLCYLPDVPCPTDASCCMQDDPRRICQGYEGRCVNPDDMPACIREEDCPATFYCDWPGDDIVQGHCLPRCNSRPDCSDDLVCRNDQHCGAGMQDGDCGGGCPGGHICHPLYNTCVENCPPCGPMEYCNPETAPECMACVNPEQCGVMMAPCCPGYKCSATVYGIVGSCIWMEHG